MALGQFNRRTGLPTLLKLAREMCRILTVFAPQIRKYYGTNVALMAALEAAEGACHVLSEQIEEALEPGV